MNEFIPIININKDSDIPIYYQITTEIEKTILNTDIHGRIKLVSAKSLAIALQINRNTALKAYKILCDKKVCEYVQGIGTFIKHNAFEIIKNYRCNLNLLNDLISDYKNGGIEAAIVVAYIFKLYGIK